MFTVPSLIALSVGFVMTVFNGWHAFRGWAAKIDTRSEAGEFAKYLILALSGLCVILASLHSLVS